MPGDAALAARLAARADVIAARSLAYMPHDAFWAARYGERGRRFAAEDAAHHLRYLCEALTGGAPDVLARYARWLRDVLVARGMCTLHLEEHFRHLRSAVAAEAEAALAVRYVDVAIDALRYPDGQARAAQDAVLALENRRDGGPRNSAVEPAFLAHYLADAITLNDPSILLDHLAWVTGAAEVTIPREAFTAVLADLADHLAATPARHAVPMLRAAIEHLASRAEEA